MKKRFLAIFIVVMMLFSQITVFASVPDSSTTHNSFSIEEVETINLNNHFCCDIFSDSTKESFHLGDNGNSLNTNVTNTVVFELKTEQNIVELNNESEGLTVLSCNYENEYVYVTFTYNEAVIAPKLTIAVLLEDHTVLTANMYGYYFEEQLFISGASRDDAFEKYCLFLLNSDAIDETEYKTIRNSYYKQSVTITASTEPAMQTMVAPSVAETQAASKTTYLKGVLVWNDDNGVEHPCQYVKVNVYDEEVGDPQLIATTYTNSNGFYSVTFENNSSIWELGGYDLYIEVFTEGEMVSVQNTNGTTYSIDTIDEVIDNVDNGSTSTISIKFEMIDDGYFVGESLAKAMQVSQPAIVASRYAKAMHGDSMPFVKVCYPATTSICQYSPSTQTIHIINRLSSNSTYPNSYAAWDVIMHEYGHHVQRTLNITSGEGGNHSSGTNNIDRTDVVDSTRKEHGTKLAWGESWPTVFAIMAQQYYIEELANIYTVGDSTYTNYSGINYSIETEEVFLGEGCERSTMYVLYDLYDSVNENHDTITLGHQFLWDLVDESNAKTFSAFIQYLYDTDLFFIDELGKLLSTCGMAASNLTVVSNSVPSFTWSGYGGSDRRPYDDYVIVFATSSREIFRTTSLSNREYTLTENQWSMLLNSGSNTIKWRVLSSGTEEYETGPYSTAWHTFNLPSITTLTMDSSVRGEIASSGAYNWYKFTAPTAGNYKLYTEGTTDTKGELFALPPFDGSSTGSIIYNDDGHVDADGNVANMGIIYTLEAGQTVYLKVSAYYTFTGVYVVLVDEYSY